MNMFEKEVVELNKVNEKIIDRLCGFFKALKGVKCEVWVLILMALCVVAAYLI